MTRFVVISVVVLAVVLAAVVVTGVDVSALRDFERDVAMMRAPDPTPDRYFDPSGHSLWLPSDLFVWDSVRAGELPIWERLQGGGYSTITSGYSGVLHPVRWIVALVPRGNAPTALIAIVFWIAITGMYALARWAFAFSPAASALAAIAFAFSGVVVSMTHFSGAILPLAHVPWIVFFFRRTGRAATAGLVATLALLFVSGHPLLEACAAMTAGAVALADGVVARSWRPVVRFALASVAAVFIAAPAWLPPLLSRADLWTYKTETGKGVSYFAYGFGDWLTALQAMVIDTYDRAGCCIDLAGFFLYVGLAAVALAVIGAIFEPRTRSIVVLLAIAFVISVPGPWMAPLHAIPPLSFFKPWYLIGAFSFFLAIVAAAGFDALWRRSAVARVIAVFLALIVAVTYVARATTVVLRPRILHGVEGGDALRFLRSDRDVFRITTLWGQTHMPNASRVTGIEDLRLVGPILTRRYHLFWQLVDPGVLTHGYPTTRVTDVLESPLVGDFNVKYILESRLAPVGTFRMDRREISRDRVMSARIATLPLVARTPWVEVRRNTRNYRPRAEFVDDAVAVPSIDDAVAVLARNPALHVVESDAPVRGGRGTVAVTYRGSRAVSMDVQSDSGGVVVLHDSYADGWKATVDGTPAAVLPVNVLSRGVAVGPGRHRIEMTYMPASLTAAAAIAAAMLLAAVFVIRRLQFPQV